MGSLNRLSLQFSAPGIVEVQEEPFSWPVKGKVLVKTLFSAISAGTEMLLYRGQMPLHMPLDTTLSAIKGTAEYPARYGYSCVGRVIDCGEETDRQLEGKVVFSFHPHESHFVAAADELIILPENIDALDALFIPFMETAVTFMLDGKPLVGERVAVFGQGVIGLLTTALLSRFPLESLITFDHYEMRLMMSEKFGAPISLALSKPHVLKTAKKAFAGEGADLVFELSGNPESLNHAISLAGFDSRIVVGSWYGNKSASVDLGGSFHRNRIRFVSSQVSTISPDVSGRWTKQRRMDTVLRLLKETYPSRLITHRIPFYQAHEAYKTIDSASDQTLQVVFAYE